MKKIQSTIIILLFTAITSFSSYADSIYCVSPSTHNGSGEPASRHPILTWSLKASSVSYPRFVLVGVYNSSKKLIWHTSYLVPSASYMTREKRCGKRLSWNKQYYWRVVEGSTISSLTPFTPVAPYIYDINESSEYVDIVNDSTSECDMTDWVLRDDDRHDYTFPSFILDAGASVRVHTGWGTNTDTDLYMGRGAAIWNNSGDTAYLEDNYGTTVDTYSY